MATLTRRAWLAILGLAPVAGGLAAWAQSKSAEAPRAKLTPRERLARKHFPNLELQTHDGRTVRFYDDLIKDKKVVLNFMYATCDGICVPVTANLVRVQKMLGDRVGRDIFFYSITLKPEEDTPEVLRKYAEMHRVGPGWLFLTGKPEDIETLRRSLGYVYDDPVEDADKSNHIGMVRYGTEPLMWWGACPGMSDVHHIYKTLLWEFDAPVLTNAGG
jgi:protein SCO1/2